MYAWQGEDGGGKMCVLTEIAHYLGNGEKQVHIVNVDHCEEVTATRLIRHVTVYDLEQP